MTSDLMVARLLLLILPFVSLGCQKRFPVVSVAGQILLDGQPLVDAQIGFEPLRSGESLEVGPGSYARTDGQGRFRLKAVNGEEGAVIGEHLVWIRTMKFDPETMGKVIAPEKLPARYHDRSELRFTVPADGTNSATFELTLGKKSKQ